MTKRLRGSTGVEYFSFGGMNKKETLGVNAPQMSIEATTEFFFLLVRLQSGIFLGIVDFEKKFNSSITALWVPHHVQARLMQIMLLIEKRSTIEEDREAPISLLNTNCLTRRIFLLSTNYLTK